MSTTTEDFVAYAADLHAGKHAAYGDSWKRRGEIMGILANVARKVDRLGVDGGGDTSADTAVDLLVYLVKYRLWLSDAGGSSVSETLPQILSTHRRPWSDRTGTVEVVLWRIRRIVADAPHRDALARIAQGAEAALVGRFAVLEQRVLDDPRQVRLAARDDARSPLVDLMLLDAYALAYTLWLASAKDDHDYQGELPLGEEIR